MWTTFVDPQYILQTIAKLNANEGWITVLQNTIFFNTNIISNLSQVISNTRKCVLNIILNWAKWIKSLSYYLCSGFHSLQKLVGLRTRPRKGGGLNSELNSISGLRNHYVVAPPLSFVDVRVLRFDFNKKRPKQETTRNELNFASN